MDETRQRYRALFRQTLATLEVSASTAIKLRKLLPLIEERFSNGATYRLIVEDLNAAGLAISHGVFTVTLSRIRARNHSTHKPAAADGAITKPAHANTRIENPTDLRAIRDMTIDLDALREEGLASRRKANPKK